MWDWIVRHKQGNGNRHMHVGGKKKNISLWVLLSYSQQIFSILLLLLPRWWWFRISNEEKKKVQVRWCPYFHVAKHQHRHEYNSFLMIRCSRSFVDCLANQLQNASPSQSTGFLLFLIFTLFPAIFATTTKPMVMQHNPVLFS